MDKCKNEADFTLGLIAYHDTPITDTTRTSSIDIRKKDEFPSRPTTFPLYPQHRAEDFLSEKRAAHLKQPAKQTSLATDQPVWVQHPITRKWHQGTVMRPDDSPHSWWMNEDNSDRL
ncbi:hypothetical protein CAPTEDRAFT_199203, partial [Capitella teleta]